MSVNQSDFLFNVTDEDAKSVIQSFLNSCLSKANKESWVNRMTVTRNDLYGLQVKAEFDGPDKPAPTVLTITIENRNDRF